MATKTGLQTLNHKDILEVDGNPAIDGGTSANDPGSIALVNNEGSGEIWLKTGDSDTDWQKLLTSSDAGIGEGEFLRLAIFDTDSSGTHIDDQVVQNGQNISVKIDAQASRTAGIEYLIPNPGDDVNSVSFVLTEGAQTINGDKTFGDNVIVNGDLTVNGTLTYINTTNLEVTDKLILLNKGGAAGSAGGSGLEFEEGGSATGYLKISADRSGFELLAPAADGALTLDASLLTAARTISAPDADGIAVLRDSMSSPVAGQVTYWDNANQVVGSSGLTYDAMAQSLTIAGGLSAQGGAFQVQADGAVSAANGNFTVDANGLVNAVDGSFQVQASGALRASNGNFTVDSSGLVSAVDGSFQVQASGALRASNGNFTVDANGAVLAADGLFNVNSDGSFNAANNKFAVDANGDLTKINNVSYSFPLEQAAGANYALLNDGAGALSWGKVAITLQDAYDNSCLGTGGGGGNSGGQATITQTSTMDATGNYTVYWNASNATGKYVQLQQYAMMSWSSVANLGEASLGYGSAMSMLISNGATLRLKLYDDSMYMMPTSPEVTSDGWTAFISGGGGGGGNPSITYNSYAAMMGSANFSFTLQDAASYPYIGIYETTGMVPFQTLTRVADVTITTPGSAGYVALSSLDPSKHYVLGIESTLGATQPYRWTGDFQIAEGTAAGVNYLGTTVPMNSDYLSVSWSTFGDVAAYPRLSLLEQTAPGMYSQVAELASSDANLGGDGSTYRQFFDATKTYALALHTLEWWDAANVSIVGSTFQVTVGAYNGGPSTSISPAGNFSYNLPSHAVAYGGAAKFGSQIVYAGGLGDSGPVSRVSFIDPVTTTVTGANSLSAARKNVAVAANTDYIVVAGGFGTSGLEGQANFVMDVYSQATQSWSAKTLPNGYYGASAVEVNGIFYIMGGSYYNSSNDTSTNQLALCIYNPVTDTFASGAPIPNARNFARAVALDGKIYFGSGEGLTSTLDVYNTAMDTWTTLTVPGSARYDSSILALNGKVYVAGGRDASTIVTDTVEVHDVVASTWGTALTMPFARSKMAEAVVGSKLLFQGGEGSGSRSRALQVYDTVAGTWGIKSGPESTAGGVGVAIGNTASFLSFSDYIPAAGFSIKYTDTAIVGARGARGRLGAAGSSGCVASITTNSVIGDFIVAGTEAFVVTAAGGMLVGSGFAVDADGETLKTNGVTYTFPASQGGSGKYLKNDGSGNLAWDDAMAIGHAVVDGTSGSMLFVDASGNLAQDNTHLFWDAANKRLGIGNDEPAATLDVSGNVVVRGSLRQADATAAMANWERRQTQISTTNAVPGNAVQLDIPDNSVVMLRAYVLARRTGGTSGAALDSGVYIRTARIKKVNGVVSLHAMQTDYTSEDQRGWSAVIEPTSDQDVHVFVTGAEGNDIDWTVNYEFIVLQDASGGDGGNSGGQPSLSYMNYSVMMGQANIFFAASNLQSFPYVSVYEVSGAAPTLSYTRVDTPDANPNMGSSISVSLSLLDPAKTYAIAANSMPTQSVPSILATMTFQVPEGTGGAPAANPVVTSASFGDFTSFMGSNQVVVNYTVQDASGGQYVKLQKYDPVVIGWSNSLSIVNAATSTSGALAINDLEDGATYRLVVTSDSMSSLPIVDSASSSFTYAAPAILTYVSTSQSGSDQVFNWNASGASALYVGLQQETGPSIFGSATLLAGAGAGTASVAISSLTDGSYYRLRLYSDSACTTAVTSASVTLNGGATASFLVDFTIPATITYTANSASGSDQVITWTAANAIGLYVGLQKFLSGPATWDSPIMLGTESDGSEAVAQSLLTNGDTYRLQLYSDSAGTTVVSNTATSGFTVSWYLQYQWQGIGVDQSGIVVGDELTSLVRIAEGSGSVTVDSTISTQLVRYRFGYDTNDSSIPIQEAAVDFIYNSTTNTPQTSVSGANINAAVTENPATYGSTFAQIMQGAKVGEVRRGVRVIGNNLMVKVHAIT